MRAFFIFSFGRITKSIYLCGMQKEKGLHGEHHMGWRSRINDYSRKGLYHITIKVADRSSQVLGVVEGNPNVPIGHEGAAYVRLTALGAMVKQELLHSISAHYPMIRVDAFVVMPEHLHFILDIRERIVSANGRETHLGQVIAGFKKGCNRRYWEMMEAGMNGNSQAAGITRLSGMKGEEERAEADGTRGEKERAEAGESRLSGLRGDRSGRNDSGGDVVSPSAVSPQRSRPPSRGTTGRQPLFSYGYVDVMPLEEGQLQLQRDYIRQNPRSRLLRTSNRAWLQPHRGGINTALSIKALLGYLQRECSPWQITTEIADGLCQRLLTESNHAVAKGEKQNTESHSSIAPTTHSPIITCDSYGDRSLLEKELLPVICHRRYKALFEQQKTLCLKAAARGAVLVSPRIAKGEQEIIDAALDAGAQVVVIADNGMPDIFHPSSTKTELCASGKLLIVSPWIYSYRRADKAISVAECKTMNCVAQALCRRRDDWWKENEE